MLSIEKSSSRVPTKVPSGSARTRYATAADDAVDAVAVEISGGLTGADRDALTEHLDDLFEVAAVEFGVRRGLAEEVEDIVLTPGLAGGLSDDLLGEDVERSDRRVEAVKATGLDRADEGGALDKLVARGGE
ncbi:MAG: hypothetical protein E6I38_04465, partial [Chloroflexi bacterium]